jgi:hypothetical protein
MRLREDCGQQQWSEQEVQDAVGRLELNSYEIHSIDGVTGIRQPFSRCVSNFLAI